MQYIKRRVETSTAVIEFRYCDSSHIILVMQCNFSFLTDRKKWGNTYHELHQTKANTCTGYTFNSTRTKLRTI